MEFFLQNSEKPVNYLSRMSINAIELHHFNVLIINGRTMIMKHKM